MVCIVRGSAKVIKIYKIVRLFFKEVNSTRKYYMVGRTSINVEFWELYGKCGYGNGIFEEVVEGCVFRGVKDL